MNTPKKPAPISTFAVAVLCHLRDDDASHDTRSLAQRMGTRYHAVHQALLMLVRRGLLVKHGRGREVRYTLTESAHLAIVQRQEQVGAETPGLRAESARDRDFIERGWMELRASREAAGELRA